MKPPIKPTNLIVQERMTGEGVGRDMVVRDVLQSRFLSAIFAETMRREVVLKGGLSFRSLFGSLRHTKDVDLQTDQSIPMGRIKALVRSGIDQALSTGLLADVVVSTPKQTDTVQRWKLNGNLPEGTPVHMTVEVSRRGMPTDEQISAIRYDPLDGGPAILIETYSPAALAASKTAALISPSRDAPRDVFDLDLLIGMKVEPSDTMLHALGQDAIARGLTDLWHKLESFDWERAKVELIPSLTREAATRLSRDEWESMRLRTGNAVEDWLRQIHQPAAPGMHP